MTPADWHRYLEWQTWATTRRPQTEAAPGLSEDVGEPELKDIDRKDVTPADTYRGDAAQWRHLFSKLVTFLTRRNAKWGELLNTIRANATDPFDELKEI